MYGNWDANKTLQAFPAQQGHKVYQGLQALLEQTEQKVPQASGFFTS